MSADRRPAGLDLLAVAEDLAGEFALRPLLERILLRCTELLGCSAGSISSVDEGAGTYRKEADLGVGCQSGQVFPLTEGMTGAVVARRAPLWFDRYDQVRGGHVAPGDRAARRGVIGVPLEWQGRVIGACVVFSRDERRVFGPADAELLGLFARHAAIALATARMHEAAQRHLRAEVAASERDRLLASLLGLALTPRDPGGPCFAPPKPALRVVVAAARPVVRAGIARLIADSGPGLAVAAEVATTRQALTACRELRPEVLLAELRLPPGEPDSGAAGVLLRQLPGQPLVGLCEAGDEKLVVEAMRAGARGCVDMGADGTELAWAVIAAVRGQAILSGPALARLHRGLRADGPGPRLTARERQVRSLMEQGLPDKAIAEMLVLSVKTVEKHAGAVLRKTGARNRTELAARAGR